MKKAVRADVGAIVAQIDERGANAVLDDDDISLGKQLFVDMEQVVDHLEGLNPGDPTYLYDAAGYITAETAAGMLFTYNSLSQLMLVANTGGAVLGHYVYDGMNRRVIKSALGTMTVYIYDIYNNLIEEYDPTTGDATRDYLYLGNKPLAMITPVSSIYSLLPPWFSCSLTPSFPLNLRGMKGGYQCTTSSTSPFDAFIYLTPFLGIAIIRLSRNAKRRKLDIIGLLTVGGVIILIVMATRQTHAQTPIEQVYYYHLDHLGTPIMMTDQSQNIVWQASYDPFGAATINTATITNNLRFPGMYADSETGLYYNMNRYYYPAIGRYIEPDPILQPMVYTIFSAASMFSELLSMFAINPQKLNNYLYVLNNPIGGIDLLGLQLLGGPNAQISGCHPYEPPLTVPVPLPFVIMSV